MVIGNKSNFAIEFGITKACVEPGQLALGFFTIHIKNCRYGVYKPDVTMLACSFDKVHQRILQRGKHVAHFATEPEASKIAVAFRNAVYSPDHEKEEFFGLPQTNFSELFDSNGLTWAPGDEAFDDSSYVLHFDIENRVRLIGFTCDQGHDYSPLTLREVYLEADEFYKILQNWCEAFDAERKAALKRQDGRQ